MHSPGCFLYRKMELTFTARWDMLLGKRLTPEVRGQSDENTNDLNAIQPVNILNGEEAQLIRDSYEHSTAF